MSTHAAASKPDRSRRTARIIISAVLVVLECFFFHVNLIAIGAMLYGVVSGVLALTSRGDAAHEAPALYRTAGWYLTLGAMMVTFNHVDGEILAKQRAQRIIDACDAYQAEHGEYPPELDALVPDYLDEVPHARTSFTASRFTYIPPTDDYGAALLYMKYPPFGRPTYDFDDARWGFLD